MSSLHAVPVLIVTGTVGVGKTTVASEISDTLSDRQIPHAFVDIDAICTSWPPQGRFNQQIAMKNLASVWKNYYEVGAERLVLACVVESEEDVRAYEEAVPGASITICRLVASQTARETRLRARELGSGLEWHLNRTSELEEILAQAELEHFLVENDGRNIHDVALEVLERAGWV